MSGLTKWIAVTGSTSQLLLLLWTLQGGITGKMMAQTARCNVLQARFGAVNTLRAGPQRGAVAGRQLVVNVANAVKFNYDTKVFQKELVKFADTEEYIYR